MKTIIWIILLSIIFLFIFRFVRKIFMLRKVFKDAINQQRDGQNPFAGNDQRTNNQTQEATPSQSRFNIEAETVEYEIIDKKHNEK